MKILFDTHAFLWFCRGDKKLSAKARHIIEDEATVLFLSVASVWEMAIKLSLGKLHFQKPFETMIPDLLDQNGIFLLPLQMDHIFSLIQLPFHHRDPFDRLLIAQAITERTPFLSCDEMFDKYQVERLW